MHDGEQLESTYVAPLVDAGALRELEPLARTVRVWLVTADEPMHFLKLRERSDQPCEGGHRNLVTIAYGSWCELQSCGTCGGLVERHVDERQPDTFVDLTPDEAGSTWPGFEAEPGSIVTSLGVATDYPLRRLTASQAALDQARPILDAYWSGDEFDAPDYDTWLGSIDPELIKLCAWVDPDHGPRYVFDSSEAGWDSGRMGRAREAALRRLEAMGAVETDQSIWWHVFDRLELPE